MDDNQRHLQSFVRRRNYIANQSRHYSAGGNGSEHLRYIGGAIGKYTRKWDRRVVYCIWSRWHNNFTGKSFQ
jgi:hypothetical protein